MTPTAMNAGFDAPGASMADCLIVGAGPAGLTAAVYLRRFLRDVVVADHGHSRALAIDCTHNYPAFPQGITGHDLLRRLREQLAEVHGEVSTVEVASLSRHPEGGFVAAPCAGPGRRFRTVLLATGVRDVVPALPGIEAVQQRGLLRQCPICDGYEHRGQHVLVLGDGPHATREAAFLAHYSPHVSHAGLTSVPTAAPPGARALPSCAARVEVLPDAGLRLSLADGSTHDFDVAYAAGGAHPRSRLGCALGAEVDEQGNLVVDSHGATGVRGLYAAGDVVSGLGQLAVAGGQGALAATAIHNLLLGEPA